MAAELVNELGLELVFLHAGPARAHRAAMGVDGDASRLAHDAGLGAALEEPHLVQQMIERDELARRVTALALRVQRLDERKQLLIELVAADRVVHAVAALEQARQDVVQVRDRERVVGTVVGDGTLGAGARPVPLLAIGVALAAEQQELALRAARHEDRHGLGLAEARQVEEVAVLAIDVQGIAAADALRRGREDGNPARADELHQMLAAAREFLGLHGIGPRDRQCTSRVAAARSAPSSSNTICTLTRTYSWISASAKSG